MIHVATSGLLAGQQTHVQSVPTSRPEQRDASWSRNAALQTQKAARRSRAPRRAM